MVDFGGEDAGGMEGAAVEGFGVGFEDVVEDWRCCLHGARGGGGGGGYVLGDGLGRCS